MGIDRRLFTIRIHCLECITFCSILPYGSKLEKSKPSLSKIVGKLLLPTRGGPAKRPLSIGDTLRCWDSSILTVSLWFKVQFCLKCLVW